MKKLLILLLILPLAFAHLEGGEDRVKDNYIIDFGYEPIPKAEEKVTLAFNLLNASTDEIIPFTDVWLRISSKEVVLSTNIIQQADHVALTYTFPYPDTYDIKIRFRNNDNLLVEEDFSLEVKGKSNFLLYVLLTIILILIVLLRKRNNVRV